MWALMPTFFITWESYNAPYLLECLIFLIAVSTESHCQPPSSAPSLSLLNIWFLSLALCVWHLCLSFYSHMNFVCISGDLLATDLFWKNNKVNKFTLSFLYHTQCMSLRLMQKQNHRQAPLLNFMFMKNEDCGLVGVVK